MEKQNINTSKLAKEINISNSGATKYIKDISIPTANIIGDIAKLFNVTIDYLVFGTEEYINDIEQQLIETFRELNENNKIIAVGEITKLLTIQNLKIKKD